MLPHEVPVLIVGAGPSGLMAALLLERQGIETLGVERRAGPQRAPAAHVLNARTLEIYRAAGLDARALDRAARPPADAGFVDWVTRLGGTRIGRLSYERQGEDQLELTPTPLRNLSQNKFEPLLLDALTVAPRWRHQWDSAQQDDDGVTARIRNLATGDCSEVRCQYLLAADGAGSRVRKSLEIPVQGPDQLETFVMIYFRAALRDRLGSPPSILSFVCDPQASGVFVAHDLDQEATFMIAYDAEQESLDDYDQERCARLVRQALEEPSLDFEIESVSTWAMTAQVAERYREGRVFLIGDSAHRFPPTGGLGLKTGDQDAHNIVWKISYVLRNLASPRLLESYESERRPVAQSNANQSLKNALQMLEVPQALGITDASESSRDRMQHTLADAAGREAVSRAISNQAEHFDMPGLQLGFSYAAEATPSDPRIYDPCGAPGHRVPHAWVEDAGTRRSLLDWVPLDRFLLLAGPEGQAWIETARTLGRHWLVARALSSEQMPALDLWLERAGIYASGALLVRPDQHVAWRAKTRAEVDQLAAAVAAA